MKYPKTVVAFAILIAAGVIALRKPHSSFNFKDALKEETLEAGDIGRTLQDLRKGAGQEAGVKGKLLLDSSASAKLNPADALDETKVGVAAKFVPIKAGEFEMGSPTDEEGRDRDEVQHRVKLSKGFEMQATAVTQLQYFLVTGRNPSDFRTEDKCDKGNFRAVYGGGLCVNHPVENVSWDDAQKFIEELNRIESKYTYRLPTEAEWEYAARGGMPSRFPYWFGFNDTNELGNHGWYDGNSGGRTHAVASKKANQYGLYDVNGNVWGWTQDWYGDYPKTAVTDPTGSARGSYRVVRGGSWNDRARVLRSALRSGVVPGIRYFYLGFRLVRSSR
jgi:formylglycine-generating enzyme required for sulfatase activity